MNQYAAILGTLSAVLGISLAVAPTIAARYRRWRAARTR